MKRAKRIWAKIYDSSGNFLRSWNDVEFSGFVWKMNGGYGEMTIKIPRTFFDFNEGGDIAFNNKVDVYISDYEDISKKVYSGYISRYTSYMDGKKENIEVICLGYQTKLNNLVVYDGNNTTIDYNLTDPTNVIKDILDKVDSDIAYDTTSMSDTGLSTTYQLIQNTAYEGIKRMTELSPAYWYWYTDADNIFHFESKSTETQHVLKVGLAIESISLTKSIENIVNEVLFVGDNMYRKYSRLDSQSEYGKRCQRLQDERVSNIITADYKVLNTLEQFDHPEVQLSCSVVDSSVNPKTGYNIELFKPGDIVRIIAPNQEIEESSWDDSNWDEAYWDGDIRYAYTQPFQIKEIQYNYNSCILLLGMVPDKLENKIIENTQNLIDYRNNDIPVAPDNT